MSIFADGLSASLSFVVQNITAPPGRSIKVFNTPIPPGQTLDLMQIPGIGEEDIRSSLMKGDLRNKIVNKQLKVIESPQIFNSNTDLLNLLGSATTIRPIPVVPAAIKDLTNNVATALFQVDLSQTIPIYDTRRDNSFGAKMFFAVECTDGTDVQIREGDVNLAAVMKGATITTAQAVNATNAVTGGTLTVTFSWSTSGSIATLQVTPSSTLTPTELEIHYFLLHATHRIPAYMHV